MTDPTFQSDPHAHMQTLYDYQTQKRDHLRASNKFRIWDRLQLKLIDFAGHHDMSTSAAIRYIIDHFFSVDYNQNTRSKTNV